MIYINISKLIIFAFLFVFLFFAFEFLLFYLSSFSPFCVFVNGGFDACLLYFSAYNRLFSGIRHIKSHQVIYLILIQI